MQATNATNAVDDLESKKKELRYNNCSFMDSHLELILEAKIAQISSTAVNVGKKVYGEEGAKHSPKHKIIGRRVRQQMHVYKILKYLRSRKERGIKSIIIRAVDKYADRKTQIEEFKLNLIEGNEVEFIKELDSLFDHISGFNSCMKKVFDDLRAGIRSNRYKNPTSGKYRDEPFTTTELSLFHYYGESPSNWIKDASEALWRYRRRIFMAEKWEELNPGIRISDGDFLPTSTVTYGRQLNKPTKYSNLSTDALENLIEVFKGKLIEGDIDFKAMLKAIAESSPGLGDCPVLTREEVLVFYLQLLDDLEIRFDVDNTLFKAILGNRKENSSFYADLNEQKVVFEDGTATSLRKHYKQRFDRVITIDVNNKLIRAYLKRRVGQLIDAELLSRDGLTILNMPAGKKGQLLMGIDFEEMMAELAEVITIAAIEEIMRKIHHPAPEVNAFFRAYKAIKDMDCTINSEKSLTPGWAVTSRTTAAGAGNPLDHIIWIDPTRNEMGTPILFFINDKVASYSKGHGGKYYQYPPENKLIKESVLNQIYFARGDGGKLKRYNQGKNAWVKYRKGLGNVDKTETKHFANFIDALSKPISVRRILISRLMGFTQDKFSGQIQFKVSLHIGENTDSAVKDAIKALQREEGKYKEIADEIMAILAYLRKKGYDTDEILGRAFWIKNPKGKILHPDEIRYNFQEGLKRSGISLPEGDIAVINGEIGRYLDYSGIEKVRNPSGILK
ncbi:MAG: hypothetical protein ACFFB3_00540 [Candidatus Hodarchaeota archaeon]